VGLPKPIVRGSGSATKVLVQVEEWITVNRDNGKSVRVMNCGGLLIRAVMVMMMKILCSAIDNLTLYTKHASPTIWMHKGSFQ
jgi:hypothetical protein